MVWWSLVLLFWSTQGHGPRQRQPLELRGGGDAWRLQEDLRRESFRTTDAFSSHMFQNETRINRNLQRQIAAAQIDLATKFFIVSFATVHLWAFFIIRCRRRGLHKKTFWRRRQQDDE